MRPLDPAEASALTALVNMEDRPATDAESAALRTLADAGFLAGRLRPEIKCMEWSITDSGQRALRVHRAWKATL